MKPSKLRYYIHDRTDMCRLQLLGSLSECDVAELNGCLGTAKTILEGRKLVVDAQALDSTDDAGREWLEFMRSKGAEVAERLSATNRDTGGGKKFFRAAATQG